MSTKGRHRGRSREPSFGGNGDSLVYAKPTASVGGKRLFSNRDSKQLQLADEDQVEKARTVEDKNEDTPSSKRYRSAEWPLKNTPDPQITPRGRAPLRRRNAPNSPTNHQSPQRPSRFLEGSMKDRVSQKPPVPYLGNDEDFLQYNAGCGESARPNSMVTDRSESTNRRSIFRFGKSIASSFNPNNWKIWSKDKTQEDDEQSAQLKALKEQQEKAERIYRELKESRRFLEATHFSQPSYPPSQLYSEHRSAGKHDSGVEFGDLERSAGHSRDMSRDSYTSREEKRMGRIFLEPPTFPGPHHRGRSPAASIISSSVAQSDTSSPNKNSFSLRKGASFSNINSPFKKGSLSNLKKAFAGASRENLANDSISDFHQARRIPSRKDLQKQQKLVKRVSDLESKLEAARRRLSEAVGEPPIPALPLTGPERQERVARRRFVPGALASLPSERLLAGYVDPDEIDLDEEELEQPIGIALTKMSTESSAYLPLKNEALPTVEKELEIADNHEDIQAQIKRESLELSPIASSEITTKVASNDVNAMHEGAAVEGEDDDKDATPKVKRIVMKRKSRFEEHADDGGIYRPSSAEDSDAESEVRKVTPKKATPKKSAESASRPNKLQKTTPIGKAQQANNQRNSASRIRPRSEYRALSKVNSLTGNSELASPPLARTLSKLSSVSQAEVQQSMKSPPTSPTFMGLKYEKPSSKVGSRAGDLPGPRYNPNDTVYSADPSTQPHVPPMPPLPKTVRLPSGEIQVLQKESIAKPQAARPEVQAPASSTKLTKSRPTPSPKKVRSEVGENVKDVGPRSKASFEWPDDVF